MFEFPILGWAVSWFMFFVWVLIWIAIAFWPARVAARKGRSFFGYFILSLFFFPLALLIAYLSSDLSQTTTTAPSEEV